MKYVLLFLSRYKKIIIDAAAISAILHITSAIASPHGITFYENNLIIKYTEIVFSIIIVAYFLKDIEVEVKRIGEDA